MLSRPGDGAANGRRVALLVADGIDTASTREVYAGLLAAGAVPRFVGRQLGQVRSVEGKGAGEPINVEISMVAGPSVLYDAVVIPDGTAAIDNLSSNAIAMDFIKDQYRHCKPILVLGAGKTLLDQLPVSRHLPTGIKDTALIEQGEGSLADALAAFIHILSGHRPLGRETESPKR